jgi:hypothetical protein
MVNIAELLITEVTELLVNKHKCTKCGDNAHLNMIVHDRPLQDLNLEIIIISWYLKFFFQ